MVPAVAPMLTDTSELIAPNCSITRFLQANPRLPIKASPDCVPAAGAPVLPVLPVSSTHPASDAAAKIAVTSAIRVFIGVFLYSIAPIVLPLLWQILIDFLQCSHRRVATTLMYVICFFGPQGLCCANLLVAEVPLSE
jgi:hypothetical protein